MTEHQVTELLERATAELTPTLGSSPPVSPPDAVVAVATSSGPRPRLLRCSD